VEDSGKNVAFLFSEPPAPLSQQGLGTTKRRLWRDIYDQIG